MTGRNSIETAVTIQIQTSIICIFYFSVNTSTKPAFSFFLVISVKIKIKKIQSKEIVTINELENHLIIMTNIIPRFIHY